MRGRPLASRYCAALLLSVFCGLLATGCRHTPVGQRRLSEKRPFIAFLVDAPLTVLEHTPPEDLIKHSAVPFSTEQLKCAASVDNTLFRHTRGQLYRLPNLGTMRVLWTGFTTDGSAVNFGIWNGRQYSFQKITETRTRKTYGQETTPLEAAAFVYVLVYAESGVLNTDAIEFRERFRQP